jgi:hypothetical protein
LQQSSKKIEENVKEKSTIFLKHPVFIGYSNLVAVWIKKGY